ncbi:MAG: ATP-binding cassette domain-containing protein, partial [Desulfovibrionaceae bacterium]|nr:ATP-binding cassette domain-containing protein [Desulfovibrionaceae bacterium]
MTDQTLLCRLEHAGLFLPGDLDRRLILQDICWDIHSGEHTVLIGRNGAGKTTLLRLLRGEAWCTQGSCAWLDGDTLSTSRIAGQGVTSMVSPAQQEDFQRHAWSISGRELMLTGFDGTPMLYTAAEPERVRMVEDMAAQLDARNLLGRNIRELSQGQLRLLLLGRAMVRRPKLLLLDECTDGLDVRHRELFAAALRKIAGISTIIMTTHRESMLPDWITRKRYVSEGRLYDTPPARDIEELGIPAARTRSGAGAARRKKRRWRTPTCTWTAGRFCTISTGACAAARTGCSRAATARASRPSCACWPATSRLPGPDAYTSIFRKTTTSPLPRCAAGCVWSLTPIRPCTSTMSPCSSLFFRASRTPWDCTEA